MNRKPRGRVSHDEVTQPQKIKMVFGVHQRCPICKGSGKRPKRKEVCGACAGTGIYTQEAPD